jgi:hypothetical protein
MILGRTAAEARNAGVVFYELPEYLIDERVDRLILPAVKAINSSGWVWTCESCQGHPDATDGLSWAGNTDPFLRLACASENFGDMLADLMRSMHFGLTHESPERPLAVRLYHTPRNGFDELLVYITATTVFARNAGIAAFERFAGAIVARKLAAPQPSEREENAK